MGSSDTNLINNRNSFSQKHKCSNSNDTEGKKKKDHNEEDPAKFQETSFKETKSTGLTPAHVSKREESLKECLTLSVISIDSISGKSLQSPIQSPATLSVDFQDFLTDNIAFSSPIQFEDPEFDDLRDKEDTVSDDESQLEDQIQYVPLTNSFSSDDDFFETFGEDNKIPSSDMNTFNFFEDMPPLIPIRLLGSNRIICENESFLKLLEHEDKQSNSSSEFCMSNENDEDSRYQLNLGFVVSDQDDQKVHHIFDNSLKDSDPNPQDCTLEGLSSFESSPEDYADRDFNEFSSTETLMENKIFESPGSFMETLPPDDMLFLVNFPEVVRNPSIVLPFQELPKPDSNARINIFISEVFSPVHFWFQLESEVENLMEMLQEDYNKVKKQQLLISDSNIKPGLLVVCFIEEFEKWHRGLVINSVNSKEEVRLVIIDYGTVGMFHKSKIKFMFEKYLDYPRYSHRGRLVNLKPPNRERMWSEKEIEKFLWLISNKKLDAEIKSFDENEMIYELDVSFTRKNANCNLKEWLISHNLADEFKLKPNSIYPACYYFPSFDMLEKNYPTYNEKSLMLDKSIDYDVLVQTNFLSCVTERMLMTTPKILRLMGHEKFKDIKNYYFPQQNFSQ